MHLVTGVVTDERGGIIAQGGGDATAHNVRVPDLAVVCADALEGHAREIEVGGPQTLTWNEVAAQAFDVLGSPARVSHVPEWLMRSVVWLVRLFNRHQGELLAFFTTMATTDVVAPPAGTHTLQEHFERS